MTDQLIIAEDFLKKGKSLLAIETLLALINPMVNESIFFYEIKKDLLIYESNLQTTINDFNKGLINRENYDVVLNKTSYGVITLIDRVKHHISNEFDSNKNIKDNIFSDISYSESIKYDEKILFNKAVAHFNLEEYDIAFSILEKLSEKIASPKVLLNYGYLLYQRQNYSKALNVFRKIIELNPYFIEAYLNAFRVCIALKNTKEARKYCDAAFRLAPYRKDVIQAKAMYYYEAGEISSYLKTMGSSISNQKNIPPSQEEINKIKNNSSTLIGSNKVSAMIVVFTNSGLRTVLIGYRDGKNNLKKPQIEYKWNPLSKKGRTQINIETIDIDEQVGMVGFRANGLENTEDRKEDILGFLMTEFTFDEIESYEPDDYLGLMFVDYDKKLRLEPKKVYIRELLALPEGDLVDLYQNMLFPKTEYVSNVNIDSPKVFLSYAREDYSIVDKIFKELKRNGIDAWQDDKSLKIGDEFEAKISTAIEESDFAIVFLSSKSVRKIGFVSKEFRKILDSAKYRPFGFPFALPIKLDDCQIPREFSSYHWLDFSDMREDIISGLVQQIKEHYKIIKDNKHA